MRSKNDEKTKMQNLRKLSIDSLWEGLILKDDVYNHDGSVLLIRAGERIDSLRLKRLSGFSGEERYIITTQRTFEQIMEHKKSDLRGTQQQIENNSGYTELKEAVGGLFEEVRDSKQVHSKQVFGIVEETCGVVRKERLSVMLSCIDTPRPIDEGLQRHSLNVAILNGIIARSMKLHEEQIQDLIFAGLVHDVGKTMIPQEILDAPRKLTAKEYEIIKKHPGYSYQLIGEDVKESIRLAALYHHERTDGKGYPEGISDRIPFYAKITAVSDVYEALVAKRSYKDERVPFDVLNMLSEGKFGLDYDTTVRFVNYMVGELRDKIVLMSDGSEGIVCYVPPNDIIHPIVVSKGIVRQTDDNWKCIRILS